MFWYQKNPVVQVVVYDGDPYVQNFVDGKGRRAQAIMAVRVAKEAQHVTFTVRLSRGCNVEALDARISAAYTDSLQLHATRQEGGNAVVIALRGPEIDALFAAVVHSMAGQYAPQIDLGNQARARAHYQHEIAKMVRALRPRVLELVRG